jgi:LemA protein
MTLKFALVAPLAALSLAGCGINSVPTAEENAKAKWANVQADYQRRADLIPNLVATVKGFAKQEKDVLIQVTQARASANQVQLSPGDLTDPAKVQAFQNAQNTLTLATRQLQEAYPELTSNANFMALQSQLEGTENRINISTKDYNEAVQAYNTTIRTFPDAIGAKIFYGAKPMVPFQATAPNADRAPTVNFN